MKSIRKRLSVIYGVVILISFVILGGILLYPLENYFLSQEKTNLAGQVRIAGRLTEPYIAAKKFDALRKLINKVSKENEVRVTVVAIDGSIIGDSEHDFKTMDNHLTRLEIQQASRNGIGFSIRKSDTVKQNMLYCAVPIKSNIGEKEGYIRLAISLSNIDIIYSYLKRILFISFALVAIIALIVVSKTARRITNPIAHLKNVAEEIALGNFTAHADVRTGDELAILANSINTMARKLDLYVQNINFEKQQLEIIFEHLGAGVVVIDSSRNIILINSFSEKLFNISRSFVSGQSLQKLVRDEEFSKVFNEAFQSNKALDYEFKYCDIYLKAHFVPLRQTSGQEKVVILIYDVTTMKQWQQLRSDFVANASHELRTPLTAIRGYTETLIDGAMEDQVTARSFLKIIERESERLTRIVEDLLDLSRLERKAPLNKELFELNALADQVTAKYDITAQKKGVIIENNIPSGVEVYADFDWLEQVLLNLVDNAVKYSKKDEKVIINAQKKSTEVEVSIADKGMGIPYEDLPRIFERFYRVDKSRSRSLGGTGLGLAIVKHIIESHGGKISVASALGEGTTITFTLPKEDKNL